jgi:glucose-1-phosphatase
MHPKENRPLLILFDIGGVIIDLKLTEARSELESKYLMESETLLRLTRSGFGNAELSITEKAMIGAISTDEYLQAFQSGCKRFVPLEDIRCNAESVLGPERPEMLDLLERLGRKVPIAAFTNTIELHWNLLVNPKNYRFPTFFRQIFASHVLGVAKPRTDAFAKVLDILGLDPNEVVFIDDSVINVSGANQLGMRGIVFERASKLREDLSHYLEF